MSSVITSDVPKFNFEQLASAIDLCLNDPSRSLLIWGGPGTGKSQCVRHIATQRGFSIVEENCGRLAVHTAGGIGFVKEVGEDNVDSSGIKADDKDVYMSRPRLIRELWKLYDEGKPRVLMLDELPNNSKDVVAIMNEAVLDNRIGEHMLPPDTVIIGTGNRYEDNAHACVMYATTANRLAHCVYDGASVMEFVKWGTASGRLAPAVCAYLEANNGHLTSNEKGRVNNASHRSWESASNVVKQHMKNPMKLGDLIQHVNCDLPKDIATGLGVYITMQGTLTTLPEIMADPLSALTPRDRELDSGQTMVAEIMQLRICKGGIEGEAGKPEAAAIAAYVKRFAPELRAAFLSMVNEGQRLKTIKTKCVTVMQTEFTEEYMSAIESALPL